MITPLSVGGLTVQPGTRDRGFLAATNHPIGNPLGCPLLVLHGAAPGPILGLVSGVHGDEYEGGEAIRRLWRRLDPASLRGSLIAVPTANLPAFAAGLRLNPMDYVNLNRVFPGKETGGVTERIAFALFSQVARRCDYLVDAHGGGNSTAHAPSALFRQGADSGLNARIYQMARATGLEWLCEEHVTGGGQLFDEATRQGIVSVGLEVGGEGRCREDLVQTDERVFTNLLRYLDMLDGPPELPPTQTHLSQRTYVLAGYGGIWRHRADLHPGAAVRAGESLGLVADVYGDLLETVVAPHDGVLNTLRTFATIQAGDHVTTLYGRVETIT